MPAIYPNRNFLGWYFRNSLLSLAQATTATVQQKSCDHFLQAEFNHLLEKPHDTYETRFSGLDTQNSVLSTIILVQKSYTCTKCVMCNTLNVSKKFTKSRVSCSHENIGTYLFLFSVQLSQSFFNILSQLFRWNWLAWTTLILIVCTSCSIKNSKISSSNGQNGMKMAHFSRLLFAFSIQSWNCSHRAK